MLYLTFSLSTTKKCHAGMEIIIIVIASLQKQMCIKKVAKMGFYRKRDNQNLL